MQKPWEERHRPPVIMGILNATPDSFYDGGSYAALPRAQQIFAEGGALIDIGGESTRPGAAAVPIEEEISRVIPALKAIKQQFPEAVISVDTYNFATARAALENGAKIINDVSALQDLRLAKLAADYGAKLVIMHARGRPQNMQSMTEYGDILKEIYDFFEDKISAAVSAGLPRESVILDVGLGFAKTTEQNWFLLENLNYFKPLSLPQLVGASRKKFTGGALDGSLKAAAFAAKNGAAILRVHDVAATKKMLEAL